MREKRRTIDRRALIHRGTWIGKGSSVAAGAKILKGVQLGEDVRVEFGAIIYGPARVGNGCYIGPKTIVGFPTQEEIVANPDTNPWLGTEPTIIGDNTIVRPGTTIYKAATLGERIRTGHNALVRERVKIGDDTLIGTNAIVDNNCTIGKHVSIQSGVYLCINCVVEDFVFLGPFCVFTNDKYVMQKQTDLVGPIVRQEASIGANALLMPEVEVGQGAIVGAQTLVTKNVPPHTIVAGVPASVLKRVPDDWKSLLREKCMRKGCHK